MTLDLGWSHVLGKGGKKKIEKIPRAKGKKFLKCYFIAEKQTEPYVDSLCARFKVTPCFRPF